MKNGSHENTWSLEIVRGADSGRRFPLGQGAVLLGNALDGSPGIDLSSLENTSPRKMAGKHARIDVSNGSLSLRDLNSPGGTFVDRRRVPPGSDLPLKSGDLIQLGGVQLRVVQGDGVAATSAIPPASDAVVTLKSGVACRTWDDVLTIAAQRWNELRDELTSGRLAASLIASGRTDLAPDAHAPGSPDERLDTWISRLPTTRPAVPELDVHPRTVVIRVVAGGGITRKKIQVSNVGYRLLKTTARIEPAGTTWLQLAPELAGKSFSTVDHTEVAIDATIPEKLTEAMTASIVFESNGGKATVTVRIETAIAKESEPIAAMRKGPAAGRLRDLIAGQSLRQRLILWPSILLAFRLIVLIGNLLIPSQGTSPGLLGPVVLFAILGVVAALLVGAKGSELRDLPSISMTGGILGAMLAALVVALFRTVESPILGLGIASSFIAFLIWGSIGAAIAFGSTRIIPPKAASEVGP
jgi:hypothetical protein